MTESPKSAYENALKQIMDLEDRIIREQIHYHNPEIHQRLSADILATEKELICLLDQRLQGVDPREFSLVRTHLQSARLLRSDAKFEAARDSMALARLYLKEAFSHPFVFKPEPALGVPEISYKSKPV